MNKQSTTPTNNHLANNHLGGLHRKTIEIAGELAAGHSPTIKAQSAANDGGSLWVVAAVQSGQSLSWRSHIYYVELQPQPASNVQRAAFDDDDDQTTRQRPEWEISLCGAR